LGQRLFPKLRFAQFASAQLMLQALGSVVLGPSLGKYLDHTGHIYRYTFAFGLYLAIAGVITLLVVHQMFMRLGGPKHYVAPEDESPGPAFEPLMPEDRRE
jgi:predicted membrane protein